MIVKCGGSRVSLSRIFTFHLAFDNADVKLNEKAIRKPQIANRIVS